MIFSPKADTKRAFTLTELLIVLAVLSLVMTIIVPSAQRGAALARRAICAKTAAHITQAYQARMNETTLLGAEPFEVIDDWAYQLDPQLGEHPLAFYCVDDVLPRQYTDRPLLEREWFGDPEQRYDLGLFSSEPIWEEYNLWDAGVSSPGIWKVNSETYAQLNLQQGANQTNNLPKYTEGGNPNVYYLLVDDEGGGGDRDFEDLVFKVEVSVTDDLNLSCVRSGTTVHTHDLIGKDWVADNVSAGAGPFVFEMRGKLSYGMNSHANRTSMTSRTILIVDHKADIIWPHVTDEGDRYSDNAAPRHLGRVNVAFADGAVESMDSDAIDPVDDDVRATMWRPSGVPDPE